MPALHSPPVAMRVPILLPVDCAYTVNEVPPPLTVIPALLLFPLAVSLLPSAKIRFALPVTLRFVVLTSEPVTIYQPVDNVVVEFVTGAASTDFVFHSFRLSILWPITRFIKFYRIRNYYYYGFIYKCNC